MCMEAGFSQIQSHAVCFDSMMQFLFLTIMTTFISWNFHDMNVVIIVRNKNCIIQYYCVEALLSGINT